MWLCIFDRLQINGSNSPLERNWRGTLQPCFFLEKAREDVEKHSDTKGALKQAILTMSVSIDQVRGWCGAKCCLRWCSEERPVGGRDRE